MKKISFLTFILLLAGCVGTTSPSHFYSLTSVDDGKPVSSRHLTVGIEEVKVPSYIDKPQMVMRRPVGVELQVSELNRWSEPLSSMLQRTIANDMGRLLPDSLVKPRNFSREEFNYVVVVEINRFEGSWGQNAVLDAWWYIMNSNGAIVLRRQSNLSQSLTEGYDNYVEVQSRLVAELSREIAIALTGLK